MSRSTTTRKLIAAPLSKRVRFYTRHALRLLRRTGVRLEHYTSVIPFTPAYRQQQEASLETAAYLKSSKRMALFMDLQHIDATLKSELKPKLSEVLYVSQLAYERRDRHFTSFMSSIFVLWLLTSYFVAIYIPNILYTQSASSGATNPTSSIILVLLTDLAWSIITVALIIITSKLPEFLGPLSLLGIQFISMLLSASTIYQYPIWLGTIPFYYVGVIASSIFSMSFLVLVIWVIVGYWSPKLIQYTAREVPRARILSDLTTILILLDRLPLTFGQTRDILFQLEAVAVCLERDWPVALLSHDPATDAWVSTRGKRMAAAVREKKKWLITPKPDTVPAFRVYILTLVTQLLNRNWDAVEQIDPETFVATRPWRERVGQAFRTIAIAGFPLAFIGALHFTPLALISPLKDYAVLISSIWAIVVLLTSLDSNFSTRLAAAQDVFNLLLPGRKP